MIIPFEKIFPEIDQSVFIAFNATVIGDVILRNEVSVWFNCVLRGDVNRIFVNERTNIQDGSILHTSGGRSEVIIGKDVTVGHNSIVHGCIIKDNVLVGMGSVILDDAVVNSNSIVAAGSVVKEGFEIPEGVLAAGIPAKIIRDISDEEIKKITQSALHYTENAVKYKNSAVKRI
ncbi:MAG TPA: gamma carbonic anhydrase family protein [Ignavibacteria bacterium]|nr:gamma carbonic anhydrase family protein [Bacteroidota bacterium]HRI84080.1 gamma carbonic anhydrase family protein [Ignavibacteria bacterium]HRK00030.1 gamma carbonic anhydrase family protein [Ignavibacteria bacterium]